MKKILIISTLQVFPPQSGGQMRTANLALALAEQGAHVFIYSLTGRRNDYLKLHSSFIQNVRPHTQEYVNLSPIYGMLQFISYKLQLPPLWATIVGMIHIPSMLKELIKTSDTIILDFPFYYPSINNIKNFGTDKKIILNTHNKEHSLWKGFVANIVKRIEIKSMKSCDNIIFCTEDDRDFFAKIDPTFNVKSLIIPNGVNVDKIRHYKADRYHIRAGLGLKKTDNVILFSAGQFGPNHEAFSFLRNFAKGENDLLTKLNITFLVVGSVSKEKIHEPHFIATSIVDDVYPYFAASDFAINPVAHGSGSNVKMFEYMAFKLTIFSTIIGARGLLLDDQQECMMFNKENLAAVLKNFFKTKSKEEQQRIGENAFKRNQHILDMKHIIKHGEENLWQ